VAGDRRDCVCRCEQRCGAGAVLVIPMAIDVDGWLTILSVAAIAVIVLLVWFR